MTAKRNGSPHHGANKGLVKETRALLRRISVVAREASLDGLTASSACWVAVIDACFFDAGMSYYEIADWLHEFADGLERDGADEPDGRIKRAAMRNQPN